MRLILKACFIYFYFISNAIIFLVCFPSVTLNSLRLFIFFFPLHSLVFSFLTDVPRSSFHFLLIPLLLFFSICLHQSSCFHSLDHLAFLALFFFPSPSASLLPPSPPPPQSSSLHFCLFVFCLVCFLKCPPIPSPSSSIPSRSPPSPALSPALIFFPPFLSITFILSFVSFLPFPAFWNISARSGLSNHPQILPTIHLSS